MKPSQPCSINQLPRAAQARSNWTLALAEIHAHFFAFQVGDNLAWSATERFRAVDPQYRLISPGFGRALHELHCAAEHPHFIRALPPVIRAARANRNRLRRIRDGNLNSRPKRSR